MELFVNFVWSYCAFVLYKFSRMKTDKIMQRQSSRSTVDSFDTRCRKFTGSVRVSFDFQRDAIIYLQNYHNVTLVANENGHHQYKFANKSVSKLEIFRHWIFVTDSLAMFWIIFNELADHEQLIKKLTLDHQKLKLADSISIYWSNLYFVIFEFFEFPEFAWPVP